MLSKGQPFYGQVDILGAPYLTGYEPILENGKVIGAWYVGFKADLAGLKTLIGQASAFGSGFVVLLDGKGRPFLHSQSASAERIQTQLQQARQGEGAWRAIEQPFPAWGFAVAVAYSEDEVAAAGRRAALPVLLSGLGITIALLALLMLVLRRVVLAPIQQAVTAANARAGRFCIRNPPAPSAFRRSCNKPVRARANGASSSSRFRPGGLPWRWRIAKTK
jgi:hypothetical protein